jgi:hypothetical protein
MTRLKLLALVFVAAGCSDAERARLGALGSAGTVKCYSGGRLFYEGRSTGKIYSEQTSDGWFFKDANTGKLVRVSGDCLVEN